MCKKEPKDEAVLNAVEALPMERASKMVTPPQTRDVVLVSADQSERLNLDLGLNAFRWDVGPGKELTGTYVIENAEICLSVDAASGLDWDASQTMTIVGVMQGSLAPGNPPVTVSFVRDFAPAE